MNDQSNPTPAPQTNVTPPAPPTPTTPPQPASVPPVVPGPKKFPWLIIVIAVIALAGIGGGIFYATRHKAGGSATKSDGTKDSGSVAEGLSQESIKYRIYLNPIDGQESEVTISDLTDKKIATNKTKFDLRLMARLNNKYFLVKEDDYEFTSEQAFGGVKSEPGTFGGHYWIIDPSGKMTQMNAAADKALRQGDSNADVAAIYPASSEEVLYYACGIINSDKCDELTKLNILTGKKETFKVTAGAPLIGVNKDATKAYFFTSDFRQTHTVIVYDLASKTSKTYPVPKLTKGQQQVWIAPSGKTFAMADHDTRVITIHEIESGKETTIQAPKDWDLSNWDGGAGLQAPVWSPDDKYIAFVAKTKGASYLAYADTQKLTVTKFDTLDTSKDAADSSVGSGKDHHAYDSVGWLDTATLTYSTANYSVIGTFGKVVGNYQYTIGGKPKSLSTQYGQLLEIRHTQFSLDSY